MAENSAHEALESVTGWLHDEPGYEIDDLGNITVAGEPPLGVQLSVDDERVLLAHSMKEEGGGASRADQVIATFPDRGTTLQAAAAVDKNGVTFTITDQVYVDGLSRQSFVTVLNSLVATIDSIGKPPPSASHDATDETKIQQAVAVIATDIEPTTTPNADLHSTPTEAAWQPTHRVPPAGMRAWSEPDPSLQPVTRLEPGVELVIAEQRGLWSRVVGSNDWTGWVDTRRLVEAGAAASPSQQTRRIGGVSIRPFPIIGGIALIVAAFLPWVSRLGSVSSFDVSLSFLWSLGGTGAPYLGWLMTALGAIALASGFTKRRYAVVVAVIGLIAVIVTAAFLVQMYRGITQGGGAYSDIFEWIGVGTWIALGAGIVILASADK